jgi:hypothetical protein
MTNVNGLKFKVDAQALVDGLSAVDGLSFRDHKIGVENIIHGLREESKRKPLKEIVEEMENARLIGVVYSDEFLEVFYTLDYVVNTYENMDSVSNAMSHARFILDQYKKKFNLQPEDFNE